MLCLCVCERDRVSCCSHYLFNQEPAVHTYGLLLLLMKWCKVATNNGGFKKGKDRATALDVLQGIIKEGVRQPFIMQVECVSEWKVYWPRPRTTPDDALVDLLIRPGGVVDFSAWHKKIMDRLDNPDQHEPLHHLAAQWLCSVNPSLDEAKCISIIDTPTKRDKMNMHRSLWRQILFQCSKHIEACQFAWC